MTRVSIVALALLMACRSTKGDTPEQVQSAPAPAPSGASQGTPASGAPSITALAPDSVQLVPNTISETVIRGSNFAATNTVRIGPITLTAVPSTGNGTEIRVVVPARYSTTEAPPRPLPPGAYAVTVEARGQTSNAVTLKVLP
jgi:hypothetical protein